MQAAKNVIKIELNHYNHILPVSQNTSSNCISMLDPIVKTEVIRERDEKRDGKESQVEYVAADSEQLQQISEVQTKNEQENEDLQQTYQEILSSAVWRCPCGKKMYGPIQYFSHIKKKHEYDTLQKLLHETSLKKVFQLYPNVHRKQLQIIEELDSISFQQVLKLIANKYESYLKGKEIGAIIAKERGSFSDMAIQFIASINDNASKSLMKLFFGFLREFVSLHIDSDAWFQQSPKDLLKYSNHIFGYFHDKEVRQRYRPFSEEDTKKIIYVLSKWMFVNKWTNDRIFHTLPSSPENEDSSQDLQMERVEQKKETEEQLP